MKEDSDKDEKTSLISYVRKSDRWIIDTGDKSKFENIGPYKGGCIKFGNDITCLVKGKGSLQLTNKIKCDNVYWV
jgi:hypothetical protein